MFEPAPALVCEPMAFERKYTPREREAIELAWGDSAIRPAGRIVELARRGELRDRHGESCEPFAVPASAVRSIGARYLRRRRARAAELAPAPADALEDLRRRLLVALEGELERVERSIESRRAGGRLPRVPIAESVRAIARAARELAALPAPGEPAPAGGRAQGGSLSQRGLAAAIVRANASGAAPALEPAARVNAAPAPVGELSPLTDAPAESLEDGASAAERINDRASSRDLEAPGSMARDQLGATSVRVRGV